MKELCIGSNEAGQRLDKFLGKYMDQAPKSFLYKMLRKKNITLNGKKALGNEILSAGDTVKLFLSDETVSKFSPFPGRRRHSKPKSQGQGTKLDILYEDKHTIFINKPAGMLSQKAAPGDVSLVEHLISYLWRAGRSRKKSCAPSALLCATGWTRNTSGIVAAGKTLAALQDLSAMFRERSLRK